MINLTVPNDRQFRVSVIVSDQEFMKGTPMSAIADRMGREAIHAIARKFMVQEHDRAIRGVRCTLDVVVVTAQEYQDAIMSAYYQGMKDAKAQGGAV